MRFLPIIAAILIIVAPVFADNLEDQLSSIGRYQFSDDGVRVLDTATGALWRTVNDPLEQGQYVMQPMSYLSPDGKTRTLTPVP